jgi:hypothetical protein
VLILASGFVFVLNIGPPSLGLAKEISNFIDFNEIYIIHEVFDAGSKNLTIFEKFLIEHAREKSFGAVRVR